MATTFRISFLDALRNQLPSKLKETILSMQHGTVGGVGRFAYAFGRARDNPHVSLWIYQFYSRHWAVAATQPPASNLDDEPPIDDSDCNPGIGISVPK